MTVFEGCHGPGKATSRQLCHSVAVASDSRGTRRVRSSIETLDCATMDALVEPLLAFLEERLPPPLYAVIINVLSHVLALSTTAFRLVGALISRPPEEWDLQSILPPIITLLAAYLALVSLYRTTTWMIRLVFWFIKWGSVIGILGLGAGWLAAAVNMNGGVDNGLLDILSSLINGRSSASMRQKGRAPSPRTQAPKERRYRAWDKFEGNRDWQYQERTQQVNNEAQVIMQQIVSTANQMFDGHTWWQMAMSVSGMQQQADGDKGTRRTAAKKTTSKSR